MDRVNYVVVKFNDKEKYAALICGGGLEECHRKAAYFRGLFNKNKDIRFGVYPDGAVDTLIDIERKGGDSLYNGLLNFNSCEL